MPRTLQAPSGCHRHLSGPSLLSACPGPWSPPRGGTPSSSASLGGLWGGFRIPACRSSGQNGPESHPGRELHFRPRRRGTKRGHVPGRDVIKMEPSPHLQTTDKWPTPRGPGGVSLRHGRAQLREPAPTAGAPLGSTDEPPVPQGWAVTPGHEGGPLGFRASSDATLWVSGGASASSFLLRGYRAAGVGEPAVKGTRRLQSPCLARGRPGRHGSEKARKRIAHQPYAGFTQIFPVSPAGQQKHPPKKQNKPDDHINDTFNRMWTGSRTGARRRLSGTWERQSLLQRADKVDCFLSGIL